jgi:hypothetical protein
MNTTAAATAATAATVIISSGNPATWEGLPPSMRAPLAWGEFDGLATNDLARIIAAHGMGYARLAAAALFDGACVVEDLLDPRVSGALEHYVTARRCGLAHESAVTIARTLVFERLSVSRSDAARAAAWYWEAVAEGATDEQATWSVVAGCPHYKDARAAGVPHDEIVAVHAAGGAVLSFIPLYKAGLRASEIVDPVKAGVARVEDLESMATSGSSIEQVREVLAAHVNTSHYCAGRAAGWTHADILRWSTTDHGLGLLLDACHFLGRDPAHALLDDPVDLRRAVDARIEQIFADSSD